MTVPESPANDIGPHRWNRAPDQSESTRMLCAGAYLDPVYRDRVIEELYVHEERVVAPSLGFDATRVLAHALRARRKDRGWAWGTLALWAFGVPLSGFLLMLFVIPSLQFTVARWIRGTGDTGFLRRGLSTAVRWYTWLSIVPILLMVLFIGFAAGGSDEFALYGGFLGAGSGAVVYQAWATVVLLGLSTWCVAARRAQFAKAVANELHPTRFHDRRTDPAESELAHDPRAHRLMRLIALEQYAPVVRYHPLRPFCGAGTPQEDWSLAVELRRDPKAKEHRELDNRMILTQIRRLVEGLRTPASGLSEDRLRGLLTQDLVYDTVDRIGARGVEVHGPEALDGLFGATVEEGGELRRGFLRIRVSAWEDGLVTTVFVRAHTQGGMLMLEVAPHVLMPLRVDFARADRTAHQYLHNNTPGKVFWALTHTLRSFPDSLTTIARDARLQWRTLTGGYARALVDGPEVSVRELAARAELSTFQLMDVNRYLRSVQDRIAHSVSTLLKESGYLTEEFEQKIITVSGGGIFVEHAGANVTVGDHNTVRSGSNTEPEPEPEPGTAPRRAPAADPQRPEPGPPPAAPSAPTVVDTPYPPPGSPAGTVPSQGGPREPEPSARRPSPSTGDRPGGEGGGPGDTQGGVGTGGTNSGG